MILRYASRLLRHALPPSLMALLFCGLLPPLWADIPAVPTQHNDNARTGANLQETILTPANVKSATFGKLFVRALDANVNGQVLYVPQLRINGAIHNVIFAYTSNNANNSPCSLYAFDADDPAASAPLWRHQFTNSAQWTQCAPTIDIANQIIYVLTKDNNDNGATRMRALDLLTGAEKTGSPITVAASVPGTGDGSVNGVVSFDTSHANCRPGLLLLNGVVYCAFAHNSDSFPYHGWIFGYHYDGTQFTQTAVFNTAPNGGLDGIWQAGKGLTADVNGNIYCAVGNGTFNPASGSYGMCYLKLSTPNLTVLDWFAPYDEKPQSDADLDQGNSGLVGIPGTNHFFAGATKFGSVFLLDSTNLGGFTPNGPDKVVQRLNGISNNDNVGQNSIGWDAGTVKYMYLWPSGYQAQQFRYDTTQNQLNPAGIWKQTGAASSGGSLAITANGNINGILWAAGNNGVFHAFDATDLSKPELWNSSQNSARDALGSVGHFQFPTVVNGKAYVPTGSATIAVYGLLPSGTVSVANGSFETPSMGNANYQYNPGGGNWTFTGASGIQSNGSAWGAPAAADGVQTAFLQGYTGGPPATISQSINFPAAGNYTLTFQAARRYGQVQPIQVSIDGANVGSPLTPAGNGFQTFTVTFAVNSAGNHTLMLATTSSAVDVTTFVDQVSLVSSAPSIAITNPSFETPSMGNANYQYNPTGGGWTFAGNSGIQSNGSAWGASNATDGVQTAFLQSDHPGSISQSINFPAAGNYTLTFQAARRYGQVQPIQISIDGANVGSPLTPAGNGFQTFTVTFAVSAAGNHTLAFSATISAGDVSSFVDQVVLTSQ